MQHWLIADTTLAELERGRALKPTAEQIAKFEAARRGGSSRGDVPPNMTVNGSEATIAVEGILTESGDFIAWLLGMQQTPYADIRAAIDAAVRDPAIRSVVLAVDSPGGTVDGLFETLGAIEGLRSKKSTTVRAKSAQSAAYALAAAAGPIQATGPAASFGSIGVAVSFFVDPRQVDITSTEAPNKRPDVTTPEGKAVVQGELDAYHELFVDAIARGRGTTTANVNKNFGKGGSVLAGKARELGMIDSIGSSKNVTTSVAALSGGKRTTMTSEEIKAAYPQAFSAIHALGVAHERDRVRAHLKFGQESGDMKTALGAIADGSELTMTLVATYLTSARGRAETAARQADSDAAGEALGDAAYTPCATGDLGDAVADLIEKRMGLKTNSVTA